MFTVCNIAVNAVHPGVNVNSQIWTKAEVILPRAVAVVMRALIR